MSPLAPDSAAANLRLLRLLAAISSNFETSRSDQIDVAIEETQRLIVETLELDRSTLWQIHEDHAGITLTHFWNKPGWVPLPRNLDATTHLPWATATIQSGKSFHYTRIEDLPAEARQDVENFRPHVPKSNVTFPLVNDGKVFGALTFSSLGAERDWRRDELDGLELVTGIIGSFIGRQRAERRAEQLRAELTRASRASMLGEIAASLAHELNQPLAAILGNAQAARRFITTENFNTTELIAILDDIIRDNKRAGSVIRDLRFQLAGSSAPHASCRINDLVREVIGFLEADLARDGVAVSTAFAPSLPKVRVARVGIQEVLVNLIHNAAQAMVRTPAEQRVIRIETIAHAGTVTVRVRDHGCGVPADQIARLFDPFHSTKPDGLGMGLAICRRIMDAHGGSIDACNHPSGGAVFTFTLPVAAKS